MVLAAYYDRNKQRTSDYEHSMPKRAEMKRRKSLPVRDAREFRFRSDEVPPPSKNRRVDQDPNKLKGQPNCIFLGDSLLKPFIQEKGLNVTAFVNDWEFKSSKRCKATPHQKPIM